MATVYSIKQCLSGNINPNESVTVKGWVKTRRDSKAGFSFIALHDGSCFSSIQLVAPNSLENYQTDVLKLTSGCAVIATGQLIASVGQGQTHEMQVQLLKVVGLVAEPESYPIQAKRHSLEYLREVAHLRPRTNTIGAVARIRNCLAFAINKFFQQQEFILIHTPIITGNDCEGAGELFRVSTLDLANVPKTSQGNVNFSDDFFGQESFLTVSGQLNVEAYCLAMSKVYTFGPTFRAENSNTSRHLAEFWMIEPEVAFANLADICQLSQQLLRFVCQTVLTEQPDDMQFFNQFIDPTCIQRLEQLIASDFEIITYTNAIKTLEKSGKSFNYPIKWGLDLQSEHERYLAETCYQRPIIIIDYPKQIKSFYMRLNDDGQTVAAMDVLVPGIGEIIGGSQREDRLDTLDKRMEEHCLDKANYQWFRDLRRYGSVPHAGFGLGFERLVCYITGMTNVRDVIAYPRTPGHAKY